MAGHGCSEDETLFRSRKLGFRELGFLRSRKLGFLLLRNPNFLGSRKLGFRELVGWACVPDDDDCHEDSGCELNAGEESRGHRMREGGM